MASRSTTVSILSDDNPNVPTLSTIGGLLLAALAGIGGLLGLRRRNCPASALAFCLATAGLLAGGHHLCGRARQRAAARCGTLQQATVSGDRIHLVLADGRVIRRASTSCVWSTVAATGAALTVSSLSSGMPVRVKQHFGTDGQLIRQGEGLRLRQARGGRRQ